MRKSLKITLGITGLLLLLAYLVQCQFIPRYTYHLRGALPTQQALQGYYEKTQSLQLDAILALLKQIQDAPSAQNKLPELIALSQGIGQSWRDHSATEDSLGNAVDDVAQLRRLAAYEQTLLAAQGELITALHSELQRLREADFYGEKHLEDVIHTYVLHEQQGEPIARWAPLHGLKQHWDETMLHPSALKRVGEFFFPPTHVPSEAHWQGSAEYLTVYLLSELYRRESKFSSNSHPLYAPAGHQLTGEMSQSHEQHLYAVTCFCPGLAVNELYKLPSRQQSPLRDSELERMRLLDLHRMSLAELRAHPRYVRDLKESLCAAHGGGVLLRLESPCAYAYLAVGVDSAGGSVSRVHFVQESQKDSL